MKRTDLTYGEIIIVRRPHQKPCSVTMFNSIEDALNAYSEEFTYNEWKNIADWEENSGFDKEYDSEIIERNKFQIHASGISDNEPFIDFFINNSYPSYFKTLSKENALQIVISDDMNGAELFKSEQNETYENFEKRIIAYYEKGRHNAPTVSMIEIALMLDD